MRNLCLIPTSPFWIVPNSNLNVFLSPLNQLCLIPWALVWFPVYISQEAMESSAFPNIITMKLMKMNMYKLMNISMSPKIMQKRSKLYVFALETSGKRPFPFWLLLRGKCINQKNINVKTLSRPNTKRTHQRAHSKLCHLDMPWTQTHSVKLSIFC